MRPSRPQPRCCSLFPSQGSPLSSESFLTQRPRKLVPAVGASRGDESPLPSRGQAVGMSVPPSWWHSKGLAHSSVLVTQSCLTLCDPMDCGPPGSSAHGILQARILEWAAMLFSRGSSRPSYQPRSPILQVDSLSAEPPGKPKNTGVWVAYPFSSRSSQLRN